ncbi:MAG: Do family serine endopeptidase [Pseudomonadales bacterium]
MIHSLRCALLICAVAFSSLTHAVLPATDSQGNVLPSLAPMLQRINSAVVNISTFSNARSRQNPLLNDPFFRRFFDTPQGQNTERSSSAGSGVIVDAHKGIVMTNHHVIQGANRVQVSLIDGRSYSARLLGSDPDLDIAILKIDANRLKQVKLADSNRSQVGDFVIAIGNPFGLGQTVTTGIVSALGRSGLGIKGYENYIQTDASINPGNSGGALVNLAGDLVGINTAIIAPAGGNVGIGFAIPINMAKASMEQILAHGEVRRGQIGVSIQDITPQLRQAFNLKNGQQGVLLSAIGKNTPAQRAGLKAGDIITAVDGKKTTSSSQLRCQIGIKRIGDKVTLDVLRDNRERKVRLSVGQPQQLRLGGNSANSNEVGQKNVHPMLSGAGFKNSRNNDGVLVSSLRSNSRAARAGLRAGDLINATNNYPVKNMSDFRHGLNRSNTSVLLQIKRNGRALFLAIR